MSRSAAIRSRSSPTGLDSHRRTVWASAPVTTIAVIHPSTATWATRHASVAASSAWTSSRAAGSPTWPLPSPYQLCSRIRSRSWSRRRPSVECGDGSSACRTRSSARSAASLSSAGGRHGGHPADERPGPLATRRPGTRSPPRGPTGVPGEPGRDRGRRACSGGRGCRTTTARRAGRRVRPGRAGVHSGGPRGRARASERTSRHSRRMATGESSSTRTLPILARASSSFAPVQHEPCCLELEDRSVAAVVVSLERHHEVVGPAKQRQVRASLRDLSNGRDGVRSQGLDLAALGAEPTCCPPGHQPGTRRVLAEQGARQRELGSRPGKYADRGHRTQLRRSPEPRSPRGTGQPPSALASLGVRITPRT